MDERKLLELKKEIERAKGKLSELKGQKEYLLKELKEKWECDSVEAAKEKVQELTDVIETLEAEIEKEIEELQNEYDI
jgi:predicted transcriptional regulator